MIDEANKKLEDLNAQLAAQNAPCNSIQSQIATTRKALADCNAVKAACDRSRQGGGKTHQRGSKGGNVKKGGSQAKLLLKSLQAERKAILAKIDEVNAQLASGATCNINLNSLNSELAAIKAALADCDAKKKAACEAPKPIDNGAFNLNTRADMNHVRTGAGRKVYGTYQRGPKKGKLKKGFKFVNGVATRV